MSHTEARAPGPDPFAAAPEERLRLLGELRGFARSLRELHCAHLLTRTLSCTLETTGVLHHAACSAPGLPQHLDVLGLADLTEALAPRQGFDDAVAVARRLTSCTCGPEFLAELDEVLYLQGFECADVVNLGEQLAALREIRTSLPDLALPEAAECYAQARLDRDRLASAVEVVALAGRPRAVIELCDALLTKRTALLAEILTHLRSPALRDQALAEVREACFPRHPHPEALELEDEEVLVGLPHLPADDPGRTLVLITSRTPPGATPVVCTLPRFASSFLVRMSAASTAPLPADPALTELAISLYDPASHGLLATLPGAISAATDLLAAS